MLHTKKIVFTMLLLGCCGVTAYLLSQKIRHEHKNTGKESQTLMTTNTQAHQEITTPSGLSYLILEDAPQGAAQPKSGQVVSVHYTGFLDKNNPTGTTFDSSIPRGKPFQFVIGAGMVIKGWDEGVMSMKVGEKRRLIIPADLGYGARGVPGVIPPNATLFFDVTLLAVK